MLVPALSVNGSRARGGAPRTAAARPAPCRNVTLECAARQDANRRATCAREWRADGRQEGSVAVLFGHRVVYFARVMIKRMSSGG